MKKPTFINSGIYHVYNRGVEKRLIFGDDKDRFRFIHDLYEMNNSLPVLNSKYWLAKKDPYMEVQLPYIRDKLVEILAFCLMPNHYHLLLQQTQDKGIIKFMQKLGTAYTNYFNLKNDRVGPLFQGRFKAVSVQENTHFHHLYNYIHLNPLDLYAPEWRDNKLPNNRDNTDILNFLKNYRWSSYPDFVGLKNFPSVLDMELGFKIIGNSGQYNTNIREWLKDMANHQNDLTDLTLE